MDEVYIGISSIPGLLTCASSADASYQGPLPPSNSGCVENLYFSSPHSSQRDTVIYPPTPAGQAFEHCKFPGSIGPIGTRAASTKFKYSSSTAHKGRSSENKDNRCSEATVTYGPHSPRISS